MDKILAAIIARLQLFEADQETDAEEVIANRYVEKVVEVITNQMSHDNIRGQLIREINQLNSTDEFVWILDVYDGYFIYEFQGKLWILNYSKANDIITIEGEPVEVVQITEYRTADGGSFVGNQKEDSLTKNVEERTDLMDRKQKIDELIKNGAWTEDDRQFLQDMDEAQFGKIMAMNQTKESDPPEEETTEEEAPTEEEPTGNEAMTVQQHIATLPAEVAEVLTNSMAVLEGQKTELIDKITANENNTFTKAQLQGKQIGELQALAKLAGATTNAQPTPHPGPQIVPNYVGQGDAAPTGNTKEEPLGLPTMNFELGETEEK